LRVEVIPIGTNSDAEIERAISDFARIPNGGLLVPFGLAETGRRNLVIGLAARHRLPVVYFNRNFVSAGGLISYGPDILDLYRQSGTYVGRVLNGRSRPTFSGADQVRNSAQPQDCQGLGLDVPAPCWCVPTR
jgi:putative ABC transport system substrate-binding protein